MKEGFLAPQLLVADQRRLAARAGYVCSFPGCHRPTSGPSDEAPDAVVNVGEACHIVAAADGKGARRRDPSMSGEKRSSIENGIWMCRTHAKLIDSDEAKYTVEQLKEWKRDAEARAERRLRQGEISARTASRLYGVPRTLSAKFVGRDVEMTQLHDVLRTSDAVRIAASVEGLPGIGKTELALQMVYRLARDGEFPGGIYWFNAENPDLEPAWGGEIADALGLAPGPLEERSALVRQQIRKHSEPTLIVLDNVEAWSPENRPRPLPEGTHLRYLVTTRQRHLGGARFEHVNVGFLDPQYARQLLESLASRELAAEPGFDDLVGHLGGHALAVELAGAFLGAYPGETPSSYLTELMSGGDIENEASDLVRYHRTVAQAFHTLWDRLDEPVRSAWRLASCFEPDPVTAELSEAVGLAAKDLRPLQRLHLIEIDAERRWWMHRLTREFGRQVGEESERAAARVAFVEGCAAFARPIDISDGFRLYLPNRSHLDSAVRLAPEVLEAEQASNFLDRIATALQSLGALKGAQRHFEQALASALENLGELHPTVASVRSNLGLVLRDLGDLEGSKALHEQALEADLENLGEGHPTVASVRSNLGLVLQDLGELKDAKALLEQALASDLKNFGEAHPKVAMRRGILAGVLQALGDLEGSKALLEHSLTSDLENLGEGHPTIAVHRSRLAGVLQALGDLEGSKALLEQALASDLDNFGEGHPTIAVNWSKLAGVLQALGDLEGAKALLEQALASALENLGEAHPNVAISRSNLAVVLKDLGDLEAAKSMVERARFAVADQPEGSYYKVNVERIARSILGEE